MMATDRSKERHCSQNGLLTRAARKRLLGTCLGALLSATGTGAARAERITRADDPSGAQAVSARPPSARTDSEARGADSLSYGRDEIGPYAIYHLQPGEALYSAVIVRFTGRVDAAAVGEAVTLIQQRSGIGDVHSIPSGFAIRIPPELLRPEYKPPAGLAPAEVCALAREEVAEVGGSPAAGEDKGVQDAPSHEIQVAIPLLVEALEDWDHDVRERAAFALGRVGPAAVPALVEALRSPKPHVRRMAALALGPIGARAEPALPALLDALGDPDPEVCREAAHALAQLGQVAVPGLTAMLQDPDAPGRDWAVLALDRSGNTVTRSVTYVVRREEF
jgi:hypothetical protein